MSLIPHFQVGKKAIHFPKFTIALLKSHLPPTHARFLVPLSFNKLDLRDYLFHAYSVRTLRITSSITQGKVSKNQKGQLTRAPSKKYMTAELAEPFVWPQEPWVSEGVSEEEWEGFERETQRLTERAERSNDVALKFDKRMRGVGRKSVPSKEERGTLAEQARRLLEGKAKWRGTREEMGQETFWQRDAVQKPGESRA